MPTTEEILRKYGISTDTEEPRQTTAASSEIVVPTLPAVEAAPSFAERIAKSVSSGAKQSAKGHIGALNWLTNLEADYQAARERMGAQNLDRDHGNNGNVWGDEPTAKSAKAQTERVRALGTKLGESSAKDMDRAKQGLGFFGALPFDLIAQGTQMAGDALAGAALGVGGLAPMVTRTFGQGVQEAQDAGASTAKQGLYGAANAALEYGTEKMFGLGSKWAYGKGASDELLTEIVNRAKASAPIKKALTLAASAAGEGIEEFVAGIVNPALQSIYNGKSVKESQIENTNWADIGYDALVGSLMGAIGGVGAVRRAGQDAAQTATAKNETPSETSIAETDKTKDTSERENATVAPLQAVTENERSGVKAPTNTDTSAANADLLGEVGKGIDLALPSVTERGRSSENLSLPTPQSNDSGTRNDGVTGQETDNAGVQGANNENGLASLTTQERINLASGARNKIISTFSDALDFVRNALTNRQNVDRAYMGKVPDAVARRVLEDTGVDVTEYQVMVNGNDVRHIMKHHGDATAEALRGQLAVTESDIARISEIIAAPDSVALSPETDGKGRRVLIFEKQIGDTLVAIEGVADGKHALETDTMRKRKSSRDTGRNAEANPSPAINAQSEPPQSSFNSEPTIPQASNVVKSSLDLPTPGNSQTIGNLTEEKGEASRSVRDALPYKAKNYLEKTERTFLRRIGDALSEASSLAEAEKAKDTSERENATVAPLQAVTENERSDIKAPTNTDTSAANSQSVGNLSEVGEADLRLPEIDTARTGKLPEGVDADAFMQRRMDEAAERKAERMRTKTREEFRGTDALDKLGVKVAGSVGEYRYTKQLVEQNRAARQIKRDVAKAEARIKATAAEKRFAQGVADGIYSLDDVPQNLSQPIVRQLSEYYTARNAANADLLGEVKKRINGDVYEKLLGIFGGKPPVTEKRPDAATLNYRTPTRNMTKIFGDKLGGAINDYLFHPVQDNEAEKTRWINKQFDKVRRFEDGEGRTRALTEDERKVTQMVLEGVNPYDIIAGTEVLRALENAAKDVGQTLNLDENAMAPYIQRWKQAAEKLRSGEVDMKVVDKAAETYRQLYADYYEGINDFLVSHGYDTIGWRKNYAPHMQPQESKTALQTALTGLGINTQVNNLPTEIAGLTASWKPNKRFDPHFLERSGHLTDFDVEKGFSEYVDYLADVLYHTDDIMKLRQFSEFMRRANTRDDTPQYLLERMSSRYTYTPEQKRAALIANHVIEDSTALSNAEIEEKYDKYVADELEQYETTYGDFVTWLDNYTNNLAGKQSFADRGTESNWGRKKLNAGRRFLQTFSNSKVAGNLSSVLNQTAQLPFILSELGGRNTGRAVVDILSNKDKEFRAKSDFLAEKHGVDYLNKTTGQKVMNALFTPASIADETLSAIAVRGKYLEAIENGHSEADAMRLADQYGRSVMASRAKGSRPIAFSNKGVMQSMLNMFQIEALNSWEHLTQDKFGSELRAIEKEQGRDAAAAQAGAYAVKTMLSAFVLNRVAEAVYGGTPAAFDVLGLLAGYLAAGDGDTPNDWLMEMIDNACEKLFGSRIFATERTEDGKPFDYKAAAKELTYNLSNDIPFVRNISGILGLGDQTLPLPNVAGGVKDIASAASENGLFSADTAKALGGLASEILPGGGQAKKTSLGAEYLARGGEFAGYGENARLKYPTSGTAREAAQALLFGKNATQAADRYYASGATPLSAQQTKLWSELKSDGADPTEVYNLIQDYREIGKNDELDSYTKGAYQRELVRNANLTDAQKIGLYAGLKNSDSLTEKLTELEKGGMTFDKIADFYDDWTALEKLGGETYTKAKYKTIRDASVTDAERRTLYLTFCGKDHRKELNTLEKSGVSVKDWMNYKMNAVGQKKEDNLAFINSMRLSSKQKDAVYLAAGYGEKALQDVPWHYKNLALPSAGKSTGLDNLALPSLELPNLAF